MQRCTQLLQITITRSSRLSMPPPTAGSKRMRPQPLPTVNLDLCPAVVVDLVAVIMEDSESEPLTIILYKASTVKSVKSAALDHR